MRENGIRRVAVLGGGIVGLSAALAFSRALPGLSVTVIETPSDPAALADGMTGTLPAVHRFHSSIGIDELDLVRAATATHLLGSRFENWPEEAGHWYHVFGDYGLPVGTLPFHLAWAEAQRTGEALPFHRYSAAAMLALSGKFVHPEPDPRSPLSTYLYALRLDPNLYLEALRARCARLAIGYSRGEFGDVERRDDGGVSALILSDGRRVEADLFLDCAGPSAPLLSALDKSFEDWSEWLPCNALLVAEGPAAPLSSCDLVSANETGWRSAAPLQRHTRHVLAFAGDLTSEAEAREVLRVETGAKDADAVLIRPGRRPQPWRHNVLAIGDGATAVDPLHGTNLHLAQSAVLRALELLPGRDCHPLELREYNRRTDQQVTRVRDFIAMHYLRSPRRRGVFWEAVSGRTVPESLAHTLDQLESRGRFPFYEEETFDRASWVAALFGMGISPVSQNPSAAGLNMAAVASAMDRMSGRLEEVAARLPSYDQYLARMAQVQPRPGGSLNAQERR